MRSVLRPISDGFSDGNLQVVGGVERFSVLNPGLTDSDHVSVEAFQGSVIDQRVQSRGPISFGDAALRGRFSRISGGGGIEIGVGLWRVEPRKATTAADLVAETGNFTVFKPDWEERSVPVIGRQSDFVSKFMGDLWIRVVVINAIGVGGIPTLGVSSLWLEVPEAAESTDFMDPVFPPPPADTLVSVRTFSGRFGTAKKTNGEWFDSSDQPFEVDSRSLPFGSDGKPQASRAVNGWRP